MRSKDSKIRSLYYASIELDTIKGHLRWSMSALAKEAGVSRTLIYHYFDGDKEKILLEAITYVGQELAGITKNKLDYWDKSDFITGIIESRKILTPKVIAFYFTHRDKESEIGNIIRDFEKKGLEKRAKFFSAVKDEELRFLYSIQFGLSLCPNLNPGDLEKSNILYKKMLSLFVSI